MVHPDDTVRQSANSPPASRRTVRTTHPYRKHLPNDRRCYVPGCSYFVTLVTECRAQGLGTDLTQDSLRAACRDCFELWPRVRVDAIVMLPDHPHAIWSVPPDLGG